MLRGGRVSTRRPHSGGAGLHLVGRGKRQRGWSDQLFHESSKVVTWSILNVFQWLMGTFPVVPESFVLVGESRKSQFLPQRFFPACARAHVQSACCFVYSEMKAGLRRTGHVGPAAPPQQEVRSSVSTLMSRSVYSRCTDAAAPPAGCRRTCCRRQGLRFNVHGVSAWAACPHPSPEKLVRLEPFYA